MRAVRTLSRLAVLAAATLAGCESTPERVFTYGAQGTEIQAQRLVAKVYGQPAAPLPYGGPEIDRPLAGMLERWPALKPWLDSGRVGLTEEGDVAVRDVDGLARDEIRRLRALVKAENRDRDVFYRGMTAAIGHGGDTLPAMLGYSEETFGGEWSRQAPAGWWLRDHRGHWWRK